MLFNINNALVINSIIFWLKYVKCLSCGKSVNVFLYKKRKAACEGCF